MDKIIQLSEPVRFGGHKIAHSIRVTTPIKITEPIPIEVYYFNEGTEKPARKSAKRSISFVVDPENLSGRDYYILSFRFELSDFTFRLDKDEVFIPTPFTFNHKPE